MSKITENEWMPLRLAIWNIIAYRMYLQQNHTRCLNATYSLTTIWAPTNLQTYLKDRLSQVNVRWSYCLFWMMHTTLLITQLCKSSIRTNKHLIARKLHNRRACHLTPRWIYMFLSPWHTILAIYSSWKYGRSLVLSDLPNIPRLISLLYVPMPLLLPYNNWTWKLSFRHTKWHFKTYTCNRILI